MLKTLLFVGASVIIGFAGLLIQQYGQARDNAARLEERFICKEQGQNATKELLKIRQKQDGVGTLSPDAFARCLRREECF